AEVPPCNRPSSRIFLKECHRAPATGSVHPNIGKRRRRISPDSSCTQNLRSSSRRVCSCHARRLLCAAAQQMLENRRRRFLRATLLLPSFSAPPFCPFRFS